MSNLLRRGLPILALLVISATLLAACGGGDTPTPPPPPPPTATPLPRTAAPPPTQPVPPDESWTRIQAAGKSLHLSVWPHETQTLLEELRPEGLMLSTSVGSEAEARDLLEKAAGWS